jgi:HEAT repeat protein
LFRDPDGSVRWQAADALVKLGGQRGLDCLETLLGDPVSGVRWKAADALKSLSWQPVDSEQHANYVVALRQYADAVQDHAAGVKPLIAALRDSGLGDFPKIVEALGKIGVLAVEPLIVALKDQNHPIREGAAAALGKIGDARAVEPLIAALHDKVARVVQHAAQALGRIRDVRAVEPLIVLLGPTFDCDNARNVAEWAASALGKIGDKRAVKPLLRIINENIPGVSDVLLTLGDTSAIKLLIDQIHARTRRGENCSWEVGKLESWIKAFGAIIEPTDLIELSQLKADASFSRKWWTGDGDERSDLIQADGAVLRNLAGEALLKRGMGTGNNIIDCLQCGQKLRIPTGKGMLLVKCPACQSQWEVLS